MMPSKMTNLLDIKLVNNNMLITFAVNCNVYL